MDPAQKIFGLVGEGISYSFSKPYFTEKFAKLGLGDCLYRVFDIPSASQIPEVFATSGLVGVNVTIPYKEQVIPYLDGLSEEARAIGAVNTVKNEGGRMVGYNSDAYGFRASLEPLLESRHSAALVLGTGGASKAVEYVLAQKGIQVLKVSRRQGFGYGQLTPEVMASHLLIVNCTPVGTSPDTDRMPPIPIDYVGGGHIVYDLIYNPAETLLLKKAAARGAATLNGLQMLHLQAEKSWEIWNRP